MHTLKSVEYAEKELPIRPAMLLHDIGKPKTRTTDDEGIDHFYGHAVISASMAVDIMRRLRYDNATIDKVRILIENHDRDIEAAPNAVRRMINRIGKNNFFDLIKVKEADIAAQHIRFYAKRHEQLWEIKAIAEISCSRRIASV